MNIVQRVRLGKIYAHRITQQQALDRIGDLVRLEQGGYVVTPNVDHVVMAETDEALRNAYRDASLSLVDGMPLVWLSHAMRTPFPEKISGSDFAEPLMARAAQDGWRVFLLGAAEGVGAEAARVWQEHHAGLDICGVYSPPLGFEKSGEEKQRILEKLRESRAQILIVALGCPKQELWMYENWTDFAPAVGLGLGATLDFVAGRVQRAPSVMSDLGMEWLYRLYKEPKRMYQRYLVRDRAIFGIAVRTLRRPRDEQLIEEGW